MLISKKYELKKIFRSTLEKLRLIKFQELAYFRDSEVIF